MQTRPTAVVPTPPTEDDEDTDELEEWRTWAEYQRTKAAVREADAAERLAREKSREMDLQHLVFFGLCVGSLLAYFDVSLTDLR